MHEVQAPTLEEFKKLVEDDFRKQQDMGLTEEQIMEYLYQDKFIEHMYQKTLEEYERGEIGIGHFTVGIPATMSYELFLCYDC